MADKSKPLLKKPAFSLAPSKFGISNIVPKEPSEDLASNAPAFTAKAAAQPTLYSSSKSTSNSLAASSQSQAAAEDKGKNGADQCKKQEAETSFKSTTSSLSSGVLVNSSSQSKSSSSGTAGRTIFTGLKKSKLNFGGDNSWVKTETEAPATTTEDEKKPTAFIPLEKKLAEEKEAEKKEEETTTKSLPIPTPMVVPAAAKEATSADAGGGGGFVFGQNLSERADNFEATAGIDNKPASTFGDAAPSSEEKKGDGQAEAAENRLGPEADASAAAAAAKKGESTTPTKTLTESAADYYESHKAQKRKFDEVETITGEEEESNVLRLNAKLHVFEKSNSSWLERGRGCLRLNDFQACSDDNDEEEEGQPKTKTRQSRLVMRTAGSLRVILNTLLYPEMTVERPSEKTIRLTGMEETPEGQQQLKVFLISSAPKDINLLYAAINARQQEVEREEKRRKAS